MPPSRPSRADVFDPGPRPAVSHELGALVVEDELVVVGLHEIDTLAGEELTVLSEFPRSCSLKFPRSRG